MKQALSILLRFLPFWLFLAVFKFGGGLHYTIMTPYGEGFMPVWIVGILFGGASLIQLVLDVPAGYLLDRFGYVPMLSVTTVAFFLSGLLIAIGLTEITYVLSLALGALGWLFYGPGGSAYILSHTSNEQAGRFFSLRDTFCSIGIVLASATLPLMLLIPSQWVGVLLCILFGMSLVLIYFAPPDKNHALVAHAPHHSRKRAGAWTLIKTMRKLNPASGMLVLLTFSGAIFYGVIWFVVPLVIAQQQANAGLLGIGLGIFDFSVVVLGYLIGSWADSANKRTMVFFGLLMFSCFGILAGLNFGWFFILFGFLATTGDEIAGISLWSWLHILDREHASDGTVSGVITLFEDLGWTIGPVFAGILYTLVGPTVAISLGALPILIVWGVYYAFVHKHFPYEIIYEMLPLRPRTRKHKS